MPSGLHPKCKFPPHLMQRLRGEDTEAVFGPLHVLQRNASYRLRPAHYIPHKDEIAPTKQHCTPTLAFARRFKARVIDCNHSIKKKTKKHRWRGAGNERLTTGLMEQLWLSRSKQNGRTNASTKRTYRSKIKGMTEWLAVHHPDTIDSSTKSIRVSLPKDAVLAFFGHIYSSAHTCDLNRVHANGAPSATMSVSSIWGYWSAKVDV
ncbi:hypothetical protein JG687_00016362 [Phytophthora cactorum]|uniref:Uncharacterized protein n=1 Tax=Phytophthora cactorum TaxID=29920 RepID=A0A8T1TUN3_9STRA|nr:hypothetical protein JG687_00016362 [Phytophthora cactorum]